MSVTATGKTTITGANRKMRISQAIARRSEIGGFIADVIKQWDAQTLSDRFELVIGSDLQFIRMNGTIVGAAVGAAIFLIDRLLAHWTVTL